MSDLDRIKQVQIGLHSSTTDFSGAPTFTSIEPYTAGVFPPDTERLDRELYRGDNGDYAAIIGPKMLDEIVLDLLARGLAGAFGGSGGAIARLTASEIGVLMDAIAGTTGTDPASTGSTTTADTGASALLTVTSGTNYANGGGVLFQTATDGYIAREQVSKSSNDLTLDRAWTDGLGADTVAYRSCHWVIDPSVNMHTHIGVRGKSSNWERTFLGCGIQGVTISGEEGKPVRFQTRWKPTDWSDTTVGPSFSAPSAGDYVVATNSKLYVAAESFMFKKWSIDLGYTVIPRVTSSGPNGSNGYIVTRKSPTFKGTTYFGSGGAGPASFGEITDSSGNISLNKIQGLTDSSSVAMHAGQAASIYDCALQLGNQPGACWYFRAPAMELSGKVVVDNGVEVIDWMGKARRPSSGTPLRFHCF